MQIKPFEDITQVLVREDIKILEKKIRWCRKNFRKGKRDEKTESFREGFIAGLELAKALVANNPPKEEIDGNKKG